MLKYFISILFLAAGLQAFGQDQEPEPEEEEGHPAIVDSAHQLRLGFDISRLWFNQAQKKLETKTSYGLELDYYWHKDLYIVAEGGFGKAALSYADLSYASDNVFFKAGINKSLLPRLKQHDWDMAFIGLRYGVGIINRGAAHYAITDSTWGTVQGTVPATHLNAHWMELTGGVRVAIIHNLFLGWNIRGKFLLNGKKFKELPPYYIAGYGKGEKNNVFDFNVYLSYAIRWNRKHITPLKPKEN